MFHIDAKNITLLPYSPVYEGDAVEIRCEVYNENEDGEISLSFGIDGKTRHTETVFVKKGCRGLASYTADLHGMAGSHTVSVNEASVPLEVVSERYAVLDGGFVMLGPPNDRTACDPFREAIKRMTDDDWKRYIDALADIGQRCVIIMAAYQFLSITDGDVRAHFDSALLPKSDIAADDPIAAILEEAGRRDMHVFIGVGNAYGWMGSEEHMREVYKRYGAYDAFYGWYLGFEFNMELFNAEKAKEADALVAAARELCPAKPILMSPFGMPSEAFVEYISQHDVFDIMMPQDCVGQSRLDIEGSKQAHRVLLDACRKAHKHLWANCEAFNFTDAVVDGKTVSLLVPRYKGGGMDGKEGFIQQMQAVRPYTEKIMTFMFSGFFCPHDFEPKMGGDAAVKQYEDYVKYAKGVLSEG